jgi:hypothetical protein
MLVIRAIMSTLLLVMIPLTGCSGEVERRWSEDVAIEGGKNIVIERYVKFTESASISGSAYSSAMLDSSLSFTGQMADLPAWKITLVPILLYRDSTTHEWVIVATTSNCDTWYQNGGPVPPYWEYRLVGSQWQQSKLSEASIGRKTNLFFDYEPKLPAKKLTPAMKADVVRNNTFEKKYLSIVGDLKRDCMKRKG